jgi:hypothetical protein
MIAVAAPSKVPSVAERRRVGWSAATEAEAMPRSKHRRKPGGKAVLHPGIGKPGKPLQAWLDELNAEPEEPDTAGLPLFDWAEKKDGSEGLLPPRTGG